MRLLSVVSSNGQEGIVGGDQEIVEEGRRRLFSKFTPKFLDLGKEAF